MPQKATEGVISTGAAHYEMKEEVGARRETTPSGLPAISPLEGEIVNSPQRRTNNIDAVVSAESC
jgi:hypothetical protein